MILYTGSVLDIDFPGFTADDGKSPPAALRKSLVRPAALDGACGAMELPTHDLISSRNRMHVSRYALREIPTEVKATVVVMRIGKHAKTASVTR